jgi:V/A-type H+-transporting ATPase subunit I
VRLRPTPAHWFETYVPRGETVHALHALAGTGVVELELDPRLARPLDVQRVRRAVDEFQTLLRPYRDLVPAPGKPPSGTTRSPEHQAETALRLLRAWRDPADQATRALEQVRGERDNLLLLYECLTALAGTSARLTRLAHRTRFLYKGVFACPRAYPACCRLDGVIGEMVPGTEHNFFILADTPDHERVIESTCEAFSCVSLAVPDWLDEDPQSQRPQVGARLRELGSRADALQKDLTARLEDRRLVQVLAEVELLRWYLEHAKDVSAEEKLCHVTGWTTADDVEALQQAFRQSGVHGVIRFARAPIFSRPPVSMALPWWARPFQLFVEMLGTPGSEEIDPSGLLPFVVPLLFGYMFPDVGHGLVLAGLSALLYRRWPQGRFLIPCGLSAAVFGVVFGEVFGLDGVIDPLWLSPMEHPLEVLLAPLGFGVALIALGMALSGIESYWHGELGAWMLREAPVAVLYASALAGLFHRELLWLGPLAVVWFLLGRLLAAPGDRIGRMFSGLGTLLQSVFELALNTFSFLRVGAFALGHAGLSIAILELAAAVQNPVARLLFLAAGHALIVAVEGLVVFVQTTRLVLFEFFIRFLRAEGRVFKPMNGPRRPGVAREP